MNNNSGPTGKFISFEGIDGAGKSTHIASLASFLKALGNEVVVTREPGGTRLAEKLRELVLNDNMDALSEALLIFAGRRSHINEVIRPALKRGEFVLCDRFTDATFAYQGYGRGFDTSVLESLEQWVQNGQEGFLTPDVTVWFDVSPFVAAGRLKSSRQPDRFEALSTEFFTKVSDGYRRRAAADTSRFIRLDASATPDQVWEELKSKISEKMNIAI